MRAFIEKNDVFIIVYYVNKRYISDQINSFNKKNSKMELVKNCHIPNCNGLHNICFNGNRAVISVNEFYKIVRHWEQNVENICGKECKTPEKYCKPHRRLNFLKMLKDSLLKRNRDQRKIIKIFEMELIRQCHHNICKNNWCFNILKKKLQWEFNKDGHQTVFL